MNYKAYHDSQFPVKSAEINPVLQKVISLMNAFKEFFEFKKDFTVYPWDSPMEGAKGYVVFRGENGEEKTFNIGVSVASPAISKKYDTKESFEQAFSDAWGAKLPIQLYDDPSSRLCGFIVESREDRVWHYISYSKV
jgi:hypothetical protein